MSSAVCPICHQTLNIELPAKFYFCSGCELSVRAEVDMPVFHYDNRWIDIQVESREVRHRARHILSHIPLIGQGRSLLDIGCGIGVGCDFAVRRGYRAVGVDSSEKNIGYATANKQGYYQVGTLDTFQTSERFDVVVAQQIIEHVRDTNRFLYRISELLMPGGTLLIETPNVSSWNPKSFWRRRIGGMYHGLDHRLVYSPKSLRTILERNGFKVARLKTKTYPPTFINETVESIKRRDRSVAKSASSSSGTVNAKTGSTPSRIYRWFVNSIIADIISLLPNYLSQRHGRGNQLIAVAIRQP